MEKILYEVKKIVVGQDHFLERVMVAMLAQGHLLVEGVPGLAKTLTVKTLARTVRGHFRRIQFTPDLLPSDVSGVSIYNQKTGDFEFRPGPIVAQVVLADEINRATPKTQSALLESMEERQVTVDGVTHPMPEPFMVLATQNPIEYEGTFPLPEAQLDRFLLRIHLGYPSMTDEVLIMEGQQRQHPIESLERVTGPDEILSMQRAVKDIYVDPLIKQYIVNIVDATRKNASVYLGASPRGSLAEVAGDAALRNDAVAAVERWLGGEGWTVAGRLVSPITGGSGNEEFLVGARRGE